MPSAPFHFSFILMYWMNIFALVKYTALGIHHSSCLLIMQFQMYPHWKAQHKIDPMFYFSAIVTKEARLGNRRQG